MGITGQYPTLAGQHADYLEQALRDYRKGGRKNAIMGTFAAQIKEEDIQVLARYYSTAEADARDGNPAELDSDGGRRALRSWNAIEEALSRRGRLGGSGRVRALSRPRALRARCLLLASFSRNVATVSR